MKQIRVQGNKILKGEISISGAKTSAVALIPAALLSDEEVTIDNIPDISDINALNEILKYKHENKGNFSWVVDKNLLEY